MFSNLRFASFVVITMLSITWGVGAAHALVVVETEDFSDGHENWFDSGPALPLTHVASGGADGGGYVSTSFSFMELEAGDTPVLFRGQEEFLFSDLEFTGNWVEEGIRELSASVRHNAPMPLTYFARVSDPANFPGAIALRFAPVFPNQWTNLTFDVGPYSSQIVTFEGSDWHSVFDNVGHIQFGVSVPAALAGSASSFTFGLDSVAISAPEPASIVSALLACLGSVAVFRKRRVK